MKSILPIALATAGLAIAAPAQAAHIVVTDTSLEDVNGPVTQGDTTTISYDDSDLSEETFEEFLTLVNDLAGLYNITIDTSSPDIDFTEVFLSDGFGGVYALSEMVNEGGVEFWSISNLALDAGTYTLNILGNNAGQGALGGTITISPAVPEPATWMMLLLGFFGTGLALRRSKTVKKEFLITA